MPKDKQEEKIRDEIKEILDINYIEDCPDLILDLFAQVQSETKREQKEEIKKVVKGMKRKSVGQWEEQGKIMEEYDTEQDEGYNQALSDILKAIENL